MSPFTPAARIERILELIDDNGDGKINFEEFEKFNRRYPQLLFPAFQLQQQLRETVRGKRYWHTQMKKRQQWALQTGRNLNIWEILETMKASDVAKQMDMVVAFNPNESDSEKSKSKEKGKKTVKTINVKNKHKDRVAPHLR